MVLLHVYFAIWLISHSDKRTEGTSAQKPTDNNVPIVHLQESQNTTENRLNDLTILQGSNSTTNRNDDDTDSTSSMNKPEAIPDSEYDSTAELLNLMINDGKTSRTSTIRPGAADDRRAPREPRKRREATTTSPSQERRSTTNSKRFTSHRGSGSKSSQSSDLFGKLSTDYVRRAAFLGIIVVLIIALAIAFLFHMRTKYRVQHRKEMLHEHMIKRKAELSIEPSAERREKDVTYVVFDDSVRIESESDGSPSNKRIVHEERRPSAEAVYFQR
ncbi:hypothetical protein Q1695_013234 [Nippostrongylus brasiliensis]|nr:hypothetical protein Q1695_013234 [Nippostrongylus brasiliensis]